MIKMYRDILAWLFDALVISYVWTYNKIAILNIDYLWVDSFGNYADAAKKIFQVIITILVVITAIYRLKREILSYKKEKNNQKETEKTE